jgi:hypothetical protein
MVSSGMLRRVALVRTDVLEELNASFIRITRIGELGTTLADEGGAKFLRNVGSYMSHTVYTSQKTPFFRSLTFATFSGVMPSDWSTVRLYQSYFCNQRFASTFGAFLLRPSQV